MPWLTTSQNALLPEKTGRAAALLLVTAALLLQPSQGSAQGGFPGRVHPELLRAAAESADSLSVWVYLRNRDLRGEPPAIHLARARQQITIRALDRRARRGRIRDVIASDLPVSASYRESLRRTGLRERKTSRWLNAVSGVVAPAELAAIASLPFVDRITPLRRGRRVEPVDQQLPPSMPARVAFPAPGLHGVGTPESGTGAQGPAQAFYGLSYLQNLSVQVTDLHDRGYTGTGIVIGIMDTGFNPTHRALSGLTVLDQYDFVNDDPVVDNEPGDPSNSNSHGTRVWSILGADWQGTMVGVAYNASFLLAKTEDVSSETPVEEDYWIAAIEWMELQGVDVTNTSLGYFDWYAYQDMDGDTAPITVAADAAVARGVVVVTSAGNEGDFPQPVDPTAIPLVYYIGAPADGDSVIAVGATNFDGSLVSFSSRGPSFDGRIKPDVVAVGSGVTTAIPAPGDSSFNTGSGTSFASPLVAGAAALILQVHPEWGPMEVLDALRNSADRTFNQVPGTPDNDYGYGAARAAWAALGGLIPPVDPDEIGIFNYPNPFSGRTTFNVTVPGAGSGQIYIFTPNGALVRTLPVPSTSNAVTVSVLWNARNEDGFAVAPGVYLAVVEFAGLRGSTTVLVVR
jgi:hypothetical protein